MINYGILRKGEKIILAYMLLMTYVSHAYNLHGSLCSISGIRVAKL